jgi:hypothetical protein
MPKSRLMPNRVTMERASLVACSMSLDAPVVITLNISSSAGAAAGERDDLVE